MRKRKEDEQIITAVRNVLVTKPKSEAEWENLEQLNTESGVPTSIQSEVRGTVEPILNRPEARYFLGRLEQLATNGFHHRVETDGYDEE